MLSCSCMFLSGLSQKDLFGEKGRDTRVLHRYTFFFVLGLEDICHACQKPLDLHRFILLVPSLGFQDILLKSFYPSIDNWIKRIHLPNVPISFNMISKCDLQWTTQRIIILISLNCYMYCERDLEIKGQWAILLTWAATVW